MLKIRAGEFAPLFKSQIQGNREFSFASLAGRYVVLAFVAGSQYPSEQHLLTGLQSLPDYRFDGVESVLLIISGDPEDAHIGRLPIGSRGAYGIYDTNDTIAGLFGVTYQVGRPVSYLLSPRMQVFGIVLAGGPQQQISTIRDALRGQPSVAQFAEAFGSAPVLIIPHVFEESLCRELMECHERAAETPGELAAEADRPLGVIASLGSRSTAAVQNPLLASAIRDRFVQRVFPQMARAYQFEARQLEGYFVARYDSSEGEYPKTKQDDEALRRRFAAAVTLNGGSYEGGELCFPEFGSRAFAWPSGSALVFSCSLLSQALPVRRGTRYAFLSLISDEAGAPAAEAAQETGDPIGEAPDSPRSGS